MESCVLIGHRDCSDMIVDKLTKEMEKLIVKYDVRVFYVGTHGNFDRMAYGVLCKLESKYNIKTVVVLAYLNDKKKLYYDQEKTIIPEGIEKVQKRYAINNRNVYMINQSDYMICYANNTFSNTYKFIKIAKKQGLEIFNIGALDIKNPD